MTERSQAGVRLDADDNSHDDDDDDRCHVVVIIVIVSRMAPVPTAGRRELAPRQSIDFWHACIPGPGVDTLGWKIRRAHDDDRSHWQQPATATTAVYQGGAFGLTSCSCLRLRRRRRRRRCNEAVGCLGAVFVSWTRVAVDDLRV